ncbi:MAG TPA: putative Ig domain-containing protein [Bryobacteraceae bacterium]|jgi:hypothetical protein
MSLSKSEYASILFTASGDSDGVPVLYRFEESGDIPPGMIFESSPCNKPGHPVCPSMARADGIFLDGAPEAAGSYVVTITARNSKGGGITEKFTITVSEK